MLMLSWNVNGIRASFRKGFLDFLNAHAPDILALQEIKASVNDIPIEVRYYPGYHIYWNPAKKKGYSGTALFTKIKPEDVRFGIGVKEYDDEGRVLTAEYERFYFVNIYFPNAQHGLTRLDYKLRFDEEIHEYLNTLRKEKPVIVCGDFNVAHKEIDLANPKQNMNNAGFTPQERAWMDRFIEDGWIDTFRMFVKDGGHYTWWSYRFNARARNIGWRIDYFIISKNLKTAVVNSYVLSDVMGSDHAPVALDINI